MNEVWNLIKTIFRFSWKAINISRQFFLNSLFLLFLLFMGIALFSQGTDVPEEALLVLNPSGNIVEELSYSDAFSELMNQSLSDEEVKTETLLKDLLDSIDYASQDDRVQGILFDLKHLRRAGTSKLQDLAKAIKSFRATGKKVIAMGDHYTQTQYYLAAQSDEVYLSPQGSILLTGYGVYRTYYKKALEKLFVNVHIFRVGKYKSAMEPFLRDDMSQAAKESNLAWLQDLWKGYTDGVTEQRSLKEDAIDGYINGMLEHLKKVEGDTGKLALEQGLVDGLKTRSEFKKQLTDSFEKNFQSRDFQKISYRNYLKAMRSPEFPDPLSDQVAVITAKGTILNGKQSSGTIGGDSLAATIRLARNNSQIKAIVLRVDSPGGSAFASEVIRSELVKAQAQGKKVVVSMGSLAASGGYWISANADKIWASPTTITGSIGIYGAVPTFEKSLDYLGVHQDGVGTTKMAGALSPAGPLNPMLEGYLQQVVEHGYRSFLNVVSEGRKMTVEEVDKIAQGKVWSGKQAKKLGLVDHLGGLKPAISSAAKLADLREGSYKVVYLDRKLSVKEELLRSLSNEVKKIGMENPLLQVFNRMGREVQEINRLNDPKGMYLHCMDCIAQ